MSQPKKTNGHLGSPIINIGVVLASQIGIVVIGIVLVAVVVGVWLDKTFSTKPIFTILLLLGSGPLSLYVVFRLATNAVNKMSESSDDPTEDGGKNTQGGQEE